MAAPVNRRRKRSYDSSSRRAQAELARQHVVDTATDLFVAEGYEATSMRRLAEAAGVSLQTLYNGFGSKFGIFSAVMDQVVAGDAEPVALVDRPEVRALGELQDPEEIVTAVVSLAVPILRRLSPIHPVLRAAASSDPQVTEAYERFVIDARHSDMFEVVAHLERVDGLRPGTDVTRAADITWTVLSPDTYELLVTRRGWSPADFADWATTSLTASLVRPDRSRIR